jgi:fucose permease
MTIAALLACGLGAALLGSIKLPLASRLHMDETRVGGLVSLTGLIMIPVILGAGFVTDLVGREVVFMSGCLLLALSLGLLAQVRSYRVALIGVVLLSCGWSLLVNVGNVLAPLAFPGGMAYATNLANVFFGLGAFLTPLVVAMLVSRLGYTRALILVGALALAPVGLAIGVDLPALVPATQPEAPPAAAVAPSVGSVLADPVLWLCGLALFCYAPLEVSMGAWATTYLGKRGVPSVAASGLLSSFWLGFMVSRLVTAFGLPAGREAVFILTFAGLSVGVLLGVVVSTSARTAMALVIASGLVFGPIFPTLMAMLLGHFAPAVHGRAVGLLLAIGGIGWAVIPLLLGAYARRTSVQRGFSVAVASAMALSAVALLLVFR